MLFSDVPWNKPSSYWVTPMTMETSIWRYIKDLESTLWQPFCSICCERRTSSYIFRRASRGSTKPTGEDKHHNCQLSGLREIYRKLWCLLYLPPNIGGARKFPLKATLGDWQQWDTTDTTIIEYNPIQLWYLWCSCCACCALVTLVSPRFLAACSLLILCPSVNLSLSVP